MPRSGSQKGGNDEGGEGQSLREIFFRPQAREKLREIIDYINEQPGNDPEDTTGLKVVADILKDIRFI